MSDNDKCLRRAKSFIDSKEVSVLDKSMFAQKVKQFMWYFPRCRRWVKRISGQYQRMDFQSYLERKLIYNYIRKLDMPVISLGEGEKYPTPVMKMPVSQAVTEAQFHEADYIRLAESIKYDLIYHRKIWEYVYILRAVEFFNASGHGKKGLGFGVGKDPMVAIWVNQGSQLLCTDLDPQSAFDKGWAKTNQYAQKKEELNERAIAWPWRFRKQVELKIIDMNSIPKELTQGEYDFVWSACAFEHLGSIEKGLQFVERSMDCLKPGGIAVHTTEFNVSNNEKTVESGETVLFRKKDMEELAIRLRAKGYKMDLNFNLGDGVLDQYFDIPPYSEYTHLKIQLGQHISTSYGVIVQK